MSQATAKLNPPSVPDVTEQPSTLLAVGFGDLLGCPFCGAEGKLAEWADGRLWLVECLKCNTQGPTKETKQEAIKAWQKRYVFGGNATDVAWCKKHGWQQYACALCQPNEKLTA